MVNVTKTLTIMDYLRENIKPSKEKNMPLGYGSGGLTDNSGITPLYRYYRDMVNDNLKIIRKGGTAYVYSIECLEDMFKYEPDMQITCYDDIYYVTL